ncbi:glycosyltransferase [Butyrivibrio sp. X503]|uniref:glycosyltransferase family 2 protein n=1 Tax=Butyrivibrio sp. X503 TaxID=2364878 RepID=UPI000EA9E150|nr:glycosyltransferase family 2 protein [Butyrivibrio sp. X503]RKM57294.1 glycosyltransferase [Butyrivibrio sp. X503]
MSRLFCVIPCYNEQEVLPETSKRLKEKFESLIAAGKISEDSRVLFVNDGSKDETFNMIKKLHEEDKLFQGINLSKNMGHQNALLAGLMTAKDLCDMAISMDADLQDDIDAIDAMVDKFNNEGCDVVYGVRSKRVTDTFFKRFTAESYYKLIDSMGAKTVYNHADYRLMSRRALFALSEFGEVNLFLRGIVPMLGFKSDIVYYERAERFAGESKYPLKKMLSFAVEGITSLSTKPIKMITGLGFSIIFITLLVFIYSLVRYFTGHNDPGWTTIVMSVWFIGGLTIFSIGIIGEYIGKIYLETKNRPRFIIESYIGDEEDVEVSEYTYKR